MKTSTWWIIGGVFALLGGTLALFNPFAASITVDLLAGWTFILSGIFAFVAVFSQDKTSTKVWTLIFAVASVWLGISLIVHPLAGVLAITMVAGIMILLSGIARVLFSFSLNGSSGFWIVLMSGIISSLLGFMILSNYPESAALILGTFLGVELIFMGFSMFAFAGALKDAGEIVDEAAAA